MTTLATMTTMVQRTPVWGGFRVWQRNLDAFRRAWRFELGGLFVEPFVLLLGVGFGLGAYISNLGEGVSYPHFLAPGVIASYAMFHATFDASYGAYMRMETHNIYESMLFTPLGPEDIVIGEVLWGASRGLMSAVAVLFVAAIFGLVSSPWAILALPVAYLIGMTFSAISMVMTATASTIGSINNFLTLFILPMFWVSGVFFPLDRLPEVVQNAAWVLPLTASAALVRGLFAGELTPWMLLWVLELLAFLLVCVWLASRQMRKRLIK